MSVGTLDDEMLFRLLGAESVKCVCEDGYMNLQETPSQ